MGPTLAFIIACEGVGVLGGLWTGPEIPSWYRTLAKPSFNPPGWIFGPVWITLYLLMAIAAWLVFNTAASSARAFGLALFLVQLALNLAWSWIFFRKHAIGAAAVEVALLWCSIGATFVVSAGFTGRGGADGAVLGVGHFRFGAQCHDMEA